MSKYDRNESIWTTDLNENIDGSYRMSRSPVSGRLRLRKVNVDRDFKFTVIFGLLFLCFLVITLGRASQPPEITRSTRAREKIISSIKPPSEYLNDRTSLINDKQAAEDALWNFYDKTGVAPFLYIIPNDKNNSNSLYSEGELSSLVKELYDESFDDEEHLLILMLETGSYEYRYFFCSGAKASDFVDAQAQQIIEDCLEHYIFIERSKVRYKGDVMQGSKAVADAFDDAGARLMRVDIDPLVYVTSGAAVLFVLVLVTSAYRRKRGKRGRLTIEKEYLPGEFIPQSVVRSSDSDNMAKGIKYRYGSEGVRGDIPYVPDGVFCTPDMLHPEMPSAEMPSAVYPKGVMLNKRKNGALMPEVTMDEVKAPFNDFARKEEKVDESEFLGGSSVSYVDNRGNTVYMNKEDNMKDQFDKWASYYASVNGQSAFKDESGETPNNTSVYHDNKGSSVLMTGDNGKSWADKMIDKEKNANDNSLFHL